MSTALQASNMPAPRTAIPPAHHARSAPVGPASYSTQLAPPRPPGPAYQVTSACARFVKGTLPRGPPSVGCCSQNSYHLFHSGCVSCLFLEGVGLLRLLFLQA